MLRLIDKAPFSSAKAEEEKLVDKLIYEAQIKADLDIKNKGVPLSYFANKFRELNDEKGDANVVLLQTAGTLYEGESIIMPNSDASKIGSNSITEILSEIEAKDNIKAIVLRIDSPGGSYQPSAEIRAGLLRLKNKGKKIIVSMGSLCASGCYYIASDADYIFADENTITGSIGVFGGKVNLSGMWNKLGVNWESIKKGDNSGLFSLNSGFSESEAESFKKSLNNVYEDFTSKVAQSRGIENIDAVARGRIFVGSDAFELNLIDEIGGLSESLKKAKDDLGLQDLSLDFYPKEKSFKEMIDEILKGKEFERIFSKTNLRELNQIKMILEQKEMQVPYFRIND